MVATSFTELHGEDGVLSFEETVERQQQTMTSREIAELPRALSLSLRLRKRLLREYPQLAPQKVARRLASGGGVFKTTPMENQYGGRLREWLRTEP